MEHLLSDVKQLKLYIRTLRFQIMKYNFIYTHTHTENKLNCRNRLIIYSVQIKQERKNSEELQRGKYGKD